MKIYAIQNGEVSRAAVKTGKAQCRQALAGLHYDEPAGDSVSFKSKAVKGAGIGALLGVGALGLISVLSGGLATPLAFGAYAATYGAIGGAAGNILDQMDEDKKGKKNK